MPHVAAQVIMRGMTNTATRTEVIYHACHSYTPLASIKQGKRLSTSRTQRQDACNAGTTLSALAPPVAPRFRDSFSARVMVPLACAASDAAYCGLKRRTTSLRDEGTSGRALRAAAMAPAGGHAGQRGCTFSSWRAECWCRVFAACDTRCAQATIAADSKVYSKRRPPQTAWESDLFAGGRPLAGLQSLQAVYCGGMWHAKLADGMGGALWGGHAACKAS